MTVAELVPLFRLDTVPHEPFVLTEEMLRALTREGRGL